MDEKTGKSNWPATLSDLLTEHYVTKSELSTLKNALLEIEAQIIEIVGVKEEGGSKTFKHGSASITTTTNFSRRVDQTKAMEVYKGLPIEERGKFHKVFDNKLSVNLRNYKSLQEHRPQLFFKFAEAVTTSQNKTSVKIKFNDNK